jgi:hypothetical protein
MNSSNYLKRGSEWQIIIHLEEQGFHISQVKKMDGRLVVTLTVSFESAVANISRTIRFIII